MADKVELGFPGRETTASDLVLSLVNVGQRELTLNQFAEGKIKIDGKVEKNPLKKVVVPCKLTVEKESYEIVVQKSV